MGHFQETAGGRRPSAPYLTRSRLVPNANHSPEGSEAAGSCTRVSARLCQACVPPLRRLCQPAPGSGLRQEQQHGFDPIADILGISRVGQTNLEEDRVDVLSRPPAWSAPDRRAIAVLLLPSAIAASTSSSRGVSSEKAGALGPCLSVNQDLDDLRIDSRPARRCCLDRPVELGRASGPGPSADTPCRRIRNRTAAAHSWDPRTGSGSPPRSAGASPSASRRPGSLRWCRWAASVRRSRPRRAPERQPPRAASHCPRTRPRPRLRRSRRGSPRFLRERGSCRRRL